MVSFSLLRLSMRRLEVNKPLILYVYRALHLYTSHLFRRFVCISPLSSLHHLLNLCEYLQTWFIDSLVSSSSRLLSLLSFVRCCRNVFPFAISYNEVLRDIFNGFPSISVGTLGKPSSSISSLLIVLEWSTRFCSTFYCDFFCVLLATWSYCSRFYVAKLSIVLTIFAMFGFVFCGLTSLPMSCVRLFVLCLLSLFMLPKRDHLKRSCPVHPCQPIRFVLSLGLLCMVRFPRTLTLWTGP